ncbi:hypothetical protein SRB5_31870 [Streptomyces sp. RB5]|uniref:Uncharacterized protein n=1 Tax=Streptomyces smaragdinus TaxID=2585196 RepID=A0A7K0CHU7_9ACTN|nr:hypothetical protein [Streptomyces smaragdinus]MQY13047.1 hypothetical protein [Streptomyces smaragdinus]
MNDQPDATLPPVGAYVVDTRTDTVGQVRDTLHGLLQLRPVGGGREWDCPPEAIRPTTPVERLHAGVATANATSRGERL